MHSKSQARLPPPESSTNMLLLAVIVACLASFRALFTARGSSQRGPAKNFGSDPEQLPLRRLDKQLAGSPLPGQALAEQRRSASNPALSSLQGKSEIFVPAETALSQGEGPTKQSTNLSRKSSNGDSMQLGADQVHVRNEYSAFPSNGF